MDKQGPRVYSTGNYIRYLVITYNGKVKVTESESRSVVSNSLLPSWTVHGILQARILEWVAYPFSGASF